MLGCRQELLRSRAFLGLACLLAVLLSPLRAYCFVRWAGGGRAVGAAPPLPLPFPKLLSRCSEQSAPTLQFGEGKGEGRGEMSFSHRMLQAWLCPKASFSFALFLGWPVSSLSSPKSLRGRSSSRNDIQGAPLRTCQVALAI